MARVRLGRFPSTEGQLARLALEQESIEVDLIGEQLSVLQGAIPSSEVMVELWVEPEQLERAQRVLSASLRENAKGSVDVRCPSCGASNPANFDVCWSCQGDLARAESMGTAARASPRPRPPVFAALFACTTLVFAALLWKERQLARFAESPNVHYRWASENCLVQEVQGRMNSRSCDYDHDGTFEQMETFDVKGRLADTWYDANEDGVYERIDSLDAQGKLISRTFDLDADWRFDRTDRFDLRERLVARETDLDGDGRIDRTEELDAGF
ncbi:MAG: hypothetical protein Q8L48_09720 [Archangium sp.]|nr:hypothetical protein [Archangium sp.]